MCHIVFLNFPETSAVKLFTYTIIFLRKLFWDLGKYSSLKKPAEEK